MSARITGVYFRNAENKTNAGMIFDGRTYRTLPKITTVAADIEDPKKLVKSVKFMMDDKEWVEKIAPYVAGGDNNEGRWNVDRGFHRLSVSLHSDALGHSPAMDAKKVSFNVDLGPLADRQCRWGVVGGLGVKPDKYMAYFHAAGIGAIRVWMAIGKWETWVPSDQDLADILAWKSQGIDVLVTATTPQPAATEAIAAACYRRLVDKIGGNILALNVGNEPNLKWYAANPKAKPPTPEKGYFNGNINQYIDLCLKPASEVCRESGVRVISGGISGNVDAFKKLLDAGARDLADEFDIHPYGAFAEELEGRLAQCYTAAQGRPLISSELNIHAANANKWASNWARIRTACERYLSRAFYYRLHVKTGPNIYAGSQGLFTADGKPNPPYHQIFQETK